MIFILLAAICFHIGFAKVIPVSDAQKKEIVNSHNEWRKNAGAVSMRRLKWNDELARFAADAVGNCQFQHTTNQQRQNIAGFPYIGENIQYAYPDNSYKKAIDSWGSEIKDYDVNSHQCRKVCGHYTQITWAKTSDVGCAMANCSKVGNSGPGILVYCNYGIGGNMQGEKPFQKGSPGSKCQADFNVPAGGDGLCGEVSSAGSNQKQNGGKNNFDLDKGPGNKAGNGDNEGQGNGNGENKGNGNGNGDGNQGSTNNGNSGDACKDEIGYCHDWMNDCGKEWTTWACRKSCKFCS